MTRAISESLESSSQSLEIFGKVTNNGKELYSEGLLRASLFRYS